MEANGRNGANGGVEKATTPRSSPFIRERKATPPAKPARRPSVGSASEFLALANKANMEEDSSLKLIDHLHLEDRTKNRRSASYSVVEGRPNPSSSSSSPSPSPPSSSSTPAKAIPLRSSSVATNLTVNPAPSSSSSVTLSPSSSPSSTSTAALRKRTPPSSGSKDNLVPAPAKPPRKISGATAFASSPSLLSPSSSSSSTSSSVSTSSPRSSSDSPSVTPSSSLSPRSFPSSSPSSTSTNSPPSSASLKLSLPTVSKQPSPPDSSPPSSSLSPSPSWSKGLVSPRSTPNTPRGASPFVKSATIQTLPTQNLSPRNTPLLSSPRAANSSTSPRSNSTSASSTPSSLSTSSSASASSSSSSSFSPRSTSSNPKSSPSKQPSSSSSKQSPSSPSPLTKAVSKNSSLVAAGVSTTKTTSVLEYFKKEFAIKKWLSETLQTPQLLDASVLQESLRDGVLLCKLMLVVDDDQAIPKIHEPPAKERLAAFKSKENISFFLYALEEFGIERVWRFQVEDLFDDRNMVKVMDCLYALANFQKKVDPPSLISEIQIQESTLPPQRMALVKLILTQMQLKEEKSKKQTAIAEATRNRSRTFAPSTGRPSAGFTPPPSFDVRQQQKKQAEEVEKRIVKFQAIVRGRIMRKRFRKIVRDIAYREKVAKEILATEELYLKNLTLLSTAFLFPMNVMSFTTAEWLKGMISNVEVIVNYSKLLLSKLKPRVEGWTPRTCLGDIFLQITNFLKVYTQYVKAYNQSLGELRKLKQDPKFQQFLKTAAKTPGVDKTEINSFIILPVQRIPRYEMLLKDLLKHTDPSHVDYKNLKDASIKVVEVAAYVDEKKGEAENIYKVLELQDLFGSSFADLAKPHRRFVFEGVCQMLVKNKAEERKVVIFNDLSVVAVKEKKKKQERYRVEKNFPLFGVTFTKLPQANGALRWGFDLRTANGSILVTLYSKSQEELGKWEKFFNTVFKEIELSFENRVPGTLTSLISPRPQGSPSPVLTPKSATTPTSTSTSTSTSISASTPASSPLSVASSFTLTTTPTTPPTSGSRILAAPPETKGSKIVKLPSNREKEEEPEDDESKGGRKRANSS